MVWCTIPKNEVIVPYFSENGNVTGIAYKRMLRSFLSPRPKGYPEDTIFQQYSALPARYSEAREYLGRKLPNRWMEEVIQSSDLLVHQILVFATYFYGNRENNPRKMAELKTKIHQKIQTIDQETLKNVFKNRTTRMNFVLREQG